MYKIFFYDTFISLRQSITIAIFLYSMHYIQDKNWKKYFIACSIACLFHNGALILFPIYFINKITLTKSLLIKVNIIFVPTVVLSFINFPILRYFDFVIYLFSDATVINKVKSIIYGGEISSIGIFHTIEYFLLMSLVIYFFNKIISMDRNAEFIVKLFVILIPLFTVFRSYEMLTRFKDYFIMTYPIIIGYICLIDNRNKLRIIQIGTICVCLFGYVRYLILFDGGALMPYASYIFKGISIWGGK